MEGPAISGSLSNDPLTGVAWDELGTPSLHYLTRTRFIAADLEHHPRPRALKPIAPTRSG